jgi:hypothetical protein
VHDPPLPDSGGRRQRGVERQGLRCRPVRSGSTGGRSRRGDGIGVQPLQPAALVAHHDADVGRIQLDGEELADPGADVLGGAGVGEGLGGEQEGLAALVGATLRLLELVAAVALPPGVEPGQAQAQVRGAGAGDVAEHVELRCGPGPGLRVDRAERPEDVAGLVGERHAGVGGDAEIEDGEVVADEGFARASAITNGCSATTSRQSEWRSGVDRLVAQGSGSPTIPGKTC